MDKNGILITVFSTASAVGKTVLAVNLTAELARQGFRVCIVDLDLQFGDVAHFLRLSPERTVYDAQAAIATSLETFDPLAYITPYQYETTDFSVVSAPLTVEQAYTASADNIGKVVAELRHYYDYVIVDTMSAFTELNLQIMDNSTLITVAAIVDFIPTIKNMKIGYETMKRIGYEANKIRFILNRSNAMTNIEIHDVEQIMDVHFYHVLPNDFKSATESVRSGVPIVLDPAYAGSPLTIGLQKLANKYTNKTGPVKTAGGRPVPQKEGLFGLFRK